MKLFKLFGKRQPKEPARLEVTGAPVTSFTTFTGDAYAVDVFRAGVDSIARVVAKVKLTPTTHFRDGSTAPCDPHLARLLQVAPNPHMTAYDYVYWMITELYCSNNVYSFIQRDRRGHVVALWPLHVGQCDFVVGGDGSLWCAFRFKNGRSAMLPYQDVIHLRRHFHSGDVAGDSNDALSTALELADMQNRHAITRIRESGTVRTIIFAKQMLSAEDKQKQSEYFAKTWVGSGNKSGVVMLDPSTDYKQLNPEITTITTEDQAATAKKVLSYLGISECIVDSSFDDEQFSAFTESVVEAISLQIGLEFTRKIFGDMPSRTIEVSTARISYLGNKSKMTLLKEAIPEGLLSLNEGRELLGYSPYEVDRRIQSLNYSLVDHVDNYQIAQVGRGITTLLEGGDDDES